MDHLHLEAIMDSNGFSFFTEELEDLVLVGSMDPTISPHLRERMPDEGEPLEGETLPEDALRTIRSWLGF
jgi:hypothetical protein